MTRMTPVSPRPGFATLEPMSAMERHSSGKQNRIALHRSARPAQILVSAALGDARYAHANTKWQARLRSNVECGKFSDSGVAGSRDKPYALTLQADLIVHAASVFPVDAMDTVSTQRYDLRYLSNRQLWSMLVNGSACDDAARLRFSRCDRCCSGSSYRSLVLCEAHATEWWPATRYARELLDLNRAAHRSIRVHHRLHLDVILP